MSERDEAAVPMEEVADVLERVLGAEGTRELRLQFTDRQGRGEKISLLFPEGGTITISANTRKPGESRRALLKFLERCEQLGREVATKLAQRKP